MQRAMLVGMGKLGWMLLLLGLWACDGDAGGGSDGPGRCAAPLSCPDADAGEADAGEGDGLPGGVGRVVVPAELGAPGGDVQFIDARDGRSWLDAHVRGARSLPETSLRTEVDGIAGQAPPVEDIAGALASVGFDRERPVVVYGATSDLAAARVLWTLEYAGHPDVRLLDGGISAWREAGLPTDSGSVELPASDVSSAGFDLARRVDADWVLAHLDDPEVVLLDARSSAEYAAGHIPGAINRDWTMSVDDGIMRALDALEALYAEIPRDVTVVAYCQTGSRAAMGYFTLRHLGYPDVRLYDGSMAEWTADPTRPVE